MSDFIELRKRRRVANSRTKAKPSSRIVRVNEHEYDINNTTIDEELRSKKLREKHKKQTHTTLRNNQEITLVPHFIDIKEEEEEISQMKNVKEMREYIKTKNQTDSLVNNYIIETVESNIIKCENDVINGDIIQQPTNPDETRIQVNQKYLKQPNLSRNDFCQHRKEVHTKYNKEITDKKTKLIEDE